MYKVGRNDPCPCGSGEKYKKCCLINSKEANISDVLYDATLPILVADFSAPYDVIKLDFLEKGINIDEPGFYDDLSFLKIEKQYSKYLNNYARFVEIQNYSIDYLTRAEKEIPFIIDIIYKELVKDGRLGACLDISGLISKVLEMAGFWNYIVKGALTLSFIPELNIENKYFWPVDFTDKLNTIAAHAWVSAPPFSIIDVSVKQQPYTQNEGLYLPDYILEKDKFETDVDTIDIISTESQNIVRKRLGVSGKEILKQIVPDAQKVMDVFKPSLVRNKYVDMKYVTVAITASDKPLKDMKNICLSGKYAFEIYKSIIEPALKNYKAQILG